jgi:hypothetical protein
VILAQHPRHHPNSSRKSRGIISFADPHPLTPVPSTLYKNMGRGHPQISHSSPMPPIFHTLFQVPYPASPLFAILTKTPGGVGVFFPFWNDLITTKARSHSYQGTYSAERRIREASTTRTDRQNDRRRLSNYNFVSNETISWPQHSRHLRTQLCHCAGTLGD